MRELENVVERAVVLARGARVEASDLPDAVTERSVMVLREPSGAGAEASGAGSAPDGFFKVRIGTPLAEVAQRLLEETLRMTKGNKTLTARILKVDPKTVFRKLKAGEAEDAEADDKSHGG